MNMTFEVTVTLRREQGKFATKEEMEAQIIEELESANPGTFTGENEGQYEVEEWDVTAIDPKRKKA